MTRAASHPAHRKQISGVIKMGGFVGKGRVEQGSEKSQLFQARLLLLGENRGPY